VTPPLTCGIALAPRRLVAVVVRPGGEARRAIRATLTDDARYGLVEYLAAAGCELVVSDALVRVDPVAQRAACAGIVVWVGPETLVAAIARAAAVTGPGRTAALLARMPGIPLLRAHLRRLTTDREPRQVPLL
jgi:hypothetical protein